MQDINLTDISDNFAIIIDEILSILLQAKYSKSVFLCCYMFYMLIRSDPVLLKEMTDFHLKYGILYHVITSLFVSTKYHEIYPL